MKLVPLCLLLLAPQSASWTATISDQGVNGGPAYTALLSNSLSLSGSTASQPSDLYSESKFTHSEDLVDGAVVTVAEPASFFASGLGLLALGLIKRRTLTRSRPN